MDIKKIIFSNLVLVIFSLLILSFSQPVTTHAESENLISNPSVETVSSVATLPQDWSNSKTGINKATFSYPVLGNNGGKAVSVTMASRFTGDAGWSFKNIFVASSVKYTYSDFYTSSVETSLIAKYKLKNGLTKTVTLAKVPASPTWKLVTNTFTTPNNAASLTILHTINKNGQLTTDDFSLTLTPTSITPTPIPPTPTPLPPTPTPLPTTVPTTTPLPPTPTPTPITPTPTPTPAPTSNLVKNPDLEISAGNTPADWFSGNWGSNTAVFTYPDIGADGSKGAKVEFTQYSDGDAKWYFADVSVEPGVQYQFSDTYQSNISSQWVVRFKDNGGAFSYQTIAQLGASSSFNKHQVTFTTPSNVRSLTVFHLINQVGFLVIDNVSLVKYSVSNLFSQGMVSLDFDDGWLSVYQNGLPILDAAGFKSTQNIITGLLAGDDQYVSSAQVLDMHTRGHQISSHTRTHPHLPALTSAQMTDEISGSKTDLINIGLNPVSLAYPYGEYSDQVIQTTKNAGYSAGRSTERGYNYTDTNRFILNTQVVESATSVDQVIDWINTAVSSKTWLILVFHQIDNSGSQYSITPQKLQQIVDYLKNQNVSVVTVSQGLQQMP